MKQVTAQQFANIFGVFVAKINIGRVFACEKKFNKSHGTWLSVYPYSTIEITPLISDADSLDWSVLIEPQEEHAEPSPVPFDENYAPEGCKAVKWVRGQNCEPCCLYQDKCDQTPVMECVPSKRPDRTDVYFVKKEDEK